MSVPGDTLQALVSARRGNQMHGTVSIQGMTDMSMAVAVNADTSINSCRLRTSANDSENLRRVEMTSFSATEYRIVVAGIAS